MIEIYKCNYCGYSFEEPKEEVEIHDEIPPPNREYFYVCPYCGDGDFEEKEYEEGDELFFEP